MDERETQVLEILNVKVEAETKKETPTTRKSEGLQERERSYKENIERALLWSRLEILAAPEELDILIRKAEELTDDEYEAIASRVFRGRKQQRSS